ncbi:hypothetical protein H6B07_20150, partial [Mediterraneibacter glycyrrhizinilyticus]
MRPPPSLKDSSDPDNPSYCPIRKTEIEILQYKPEAATYFDQVEEQFNATHDDIHLTISSPNDA